MAFDKLIDALNEFRGEYTKALTDSLQGGSTLGTGEGQGYVASGELGKSLRIGVQPKVKLFGQIYRMQIRMAEHGEYLDKGRKPGKGVPPTVLEEWLRLPNVLARVTGQDARLKDYQINSLAFVINRSIKQKGIKPKNWLQPAFDKVTPKIAGVVEAAIAEDIELTFEQIKKLIES
jgi:hypothetical protein